MRGLAILLVIFAHAVSTVSDNGIVMNIFRSLSGNSTVLFVMIAGFLFHEMSHNFNFGEYIVNKIKFVLLPYIIMSIPAALLYMTGVKTDHNWMDVQWLQSLSLAKQYLYLMVTGAHLGPLWFIPMVMIFYIISPVLIYLQQKPYGLHIAFAITLVCAVIIGRPLLNDDTLQAFVYMLPAYIFGVILAKYDFVNKYDIKHSLFFITLSTLLIVIMDVLFKVGSGNDLLIRIVFSVTVFCCCIQFLNKHNKWINLFARLSFYLFFIHGYFIAAFRIIFSKLPDTDVSFLLVFIAFFGTIILSLATYVALKTFLGKRSKILIGA